MSALSDKLRNRARFETAASTSRENDHIDWMQADELLQRARELESRAGYARPRVRSCTSFSYDPVSA